MSKSPSTQSSSPVTLKEIKTKMALPPIPQAPTRDRRDRDRDRNRIRMEISAEQCGVILAFLGSQLREMGITHQDFQPMYSLYHSLKRQKDLLENTNA